MLQFQNGILVNHSKCILFLSLFMSHYVVASVKQARSMYYYGFGK